jgi:hypothetical protein
VSPVVSYSASQCRMILVWQKGEWLYTGKWIYFLVYEMAVAYSVRSCTL